MSVDFGKLLREQQEREAGTMTECMKVWHTPQWDYDSLSVIQREHVCILGLGHVGNHRDAAGNVRVRFEE